MATYLRRILNSKGRRIITIMLIAVVLISSVSLATYLSNTPQRAHAESITNDILFIHGISGNKPYGSGDSVSGGCIGTWGGAEDFAHRLFGWAGQLKMVGYYRVDGDNAPPPALNYQSVVKKASEITAR